MKYVICGLILLLLIIHQDFWLWDDSRLIFGIIPIGLFYHACISVAASLTWLLATIYAWPENLDQAEPASSTATDNGGEA